MSKPEVTFVLTSCGRVDLLERTIESFEKHNTYPIKRGIITEDSCDEEVYKQVRELFGDRYEIWANEEKKGQIKSIIDAYETIETDYVFHCEDDWNFYKDGFIEESFAILNSNPMITQVWLRTQEDLNRNENFFTFGDVEEAEGYKFRRVTPTGDYEWGSFSFNPGIKRMSDYHKMNGFTDCFSELDVNLRYRDAGYYCVIADTSGVEHLGDDRRLDDPTRKWVKRRKPNKPKGLKRLWAHIHSLFTTGKW